MNSGKGLSVDGAQKERHVSNNRSISCTTTERVASIREEIQSLRKKIKQWTDAVKEAETEIRLLEYHLQVLCSNPPKTHIGRYPICESRGYMSMLGQDLQANTSVTSMTLELWLGREESMQSIQPLLQFIENSNSLEKVTLEPKDNVLGARKKEVTLVSVQLADAFMNAAARNPNIKSIECYKIHPSAGPLCGFEPKCNKCRLEIDILKLFPSTDDQNRIASYLVMMMQHNATRLSLHARDDRYFCFQWDRSSEYELHCPQSCDFPTALTTTNGSFLGMSQLTAIALSDMNDTRWDNLFQCLYKMPSLVDVCVRGCTMNPVTAHGLRNYLTRKPNPPTLKIEQWHNDADLTGQSRVQLLADFLSSLPNTSNIEELSLSCASSSPLGIILGCLTASGRPRIAKLKISAIKETDIPVLVSLLPQCMSIERLVISHYMDARVFHPIVRAVLENEFVTNVEFKHGFRSDRGMDQTTMKCINEHCSRNQIHSALSLVAEPANKMLLPTMLQVLSQLKRSRASTTLKSLLICGNYIGPVLGLSQCWEQAKVPKSSKSCPVKSNVSRRHSKYRSK